MDAPALGRSATVVKNYPADRYMLVMWDHGGGPVYGFGYDQFQDESVALTLDEMTGRWAAGGAVSSRAVATSSRKARSQAVATSSRNASVRSRTRRLATSQAASGHRARTELNGTAFCPYGMNHYPEDV